MIKKLNAIGWCAGSALFFALLLFLSPQSRAASELVGAEDVNVHTNGAAFIIDADIHAPVRPDRAFAVVTDFSHMASFLPNLHTSEVLARDGDILQVHQTGTTYFSFIPIDFESLREVRLDAPHKVVAHGIRGNFKKMDSVMTLEDEGTGTHLHYHAEIEPSFAMPFGLGTETVRQQTAGQFTAMLREMQRRE